MHIVSQIGEVYVTVEPVDKHGINEVRHSIITYQSDPKHELDGYCLEGVWVKNAKLSGNVEEVLELANETVDMFFRTITNEPLSLYWQNVEDAQIETFNTSQRTVFELSVVLDDETIIEELLEGETHD